MKVMGKMHVFLLVILFLLILGSFLKFFPITLNWEGENCYLEVKACIITKEGKFIEVVSPIWINGAKDWANRPFVFKCGSVVNITAPKEYVGYKFAFWQKEDPDKPTFQGKIVTDRHLIILINEKKQIWWINYRE